MYRIGFIFALVAACFSCIPTLHAAPVAVSLAELSQNDSVNWSQLGSDGTTLSNIFNATSAGGIGINASTFYFGYNSVQAVCGNPPDYATCSFYPPGPGFNTGDSLIVTSDYNANGKGNGPLTVAFGKGVDGAGAYIASEASGVFTAQLQVYSGSTLLLTTSAVSDLNSDPVFLGALDTTNDITSEVFSLLSVDPNGGADVNNFAINTLSLNTAAVTATPEPASLSLLLLAGTGLVFLLVSSNRRALNRSNFGK
jgi:hypothetical protein